MNHFGRLEYRMMFDDPRLFFTDIFKSNYGDDYSGLFRSHGSYWNDLKNNILIKMLAFMNILSRGNYYINSLFFNFLCFFGHIALYRAFRKIYPTQKWILIIVCFLLPSTLYFTSGINKDNISFAITGLVVLGLYKWLYERLTDIQKLLLITGYVFLFLIRPHTALAMIPAGLALWLMLKTKWKAVAVAILIPVVLIFISFLIDTIAPSYSPLKPILAKQEDFVQMRAKTELEPIKFEPSTLSLLKGIPEALDRSLVMPHPWRLHSNPFLQILSVEAALYLLILLSGMALILSHQRKLHPLVWFGLVFSLISLVIIGLIVPHVGAVIRYRALFYPFLLLPFMIGISTQVKRYIRNKNILFICHRFIHFFRFPKK